MRTPSIPSGRSLALGVSIALVAAGSLLPAPAVGWLLRHAPWFATFWAWLNEALPGWNPLHVLVWAWLGLLCTRVGGRGAWRRNAAALALLSAAIEALQHLAPGRGPRLGDLADNLFGIALGVVAGLLLARALRTLRDKTPERR